MFRRNFNIKTQIVFYLSKLIVDCCTQTGLSVSFSKEVLSIIFLFISLLYSNHVIKLFEGNF